MKKPVALLITDTHLSDNNIELVISIFKQAIEYCVKNNIQEIYHLGDWFTSRKAQSLDVLKATMDIIGDFMRNGITCSIIKGNHDAVQADTEDSYLDIFSIYEYFLVCKREFTFKIPQVENFYIHLLPYFKEDGSYIERLKNLEIKPGINILLTHIAVTGVKNNDGSEVENNLGLDLFKQYDAVYVGHYHNQSDVGKNIKYIGSAYQANFGEDDKKGFNLLLEDGSLQFIQSEFPKYIKIKANVADKKHLLEIKQKHAHSKDYVRVIVDGDESELKALNKEEFAAIGIDVKTEKGDAIIDIKSLMNTTVSFDTKGIKEGFEEFCQLNEIKNKEEGIVYLEKVL